ncbi:MAG: response regulator transcription factor [Bacteroidetes bacterium]|nr:response regulator transcription factor [Bacteroidota bacterium]
MVNKIKIALADDKRYLAQEIIEKLQSYHEEIEFRFYELNGIDLLDHLKIESEIDVILMDIQMPEMDGIEATTIVKQLYPHIKIIMLTVFDDDTKILQSIQAGASGYLLKEITTNELYKGILSIINGGAPMSPTVAYKTLKLLQSADIPVTENSAKNKILSTRETEVLESICNGLNYKEIAKILFIAPTTVRKHIANIYEKLHVNNKMQAVAIAQKYQII